MLKPAIPVPRPDSDPAIRALKENVEILTGRRGAQVQQLAIVPQVTTATVADINSVISSLNVVINKMNELLTKLQS